MSVVGSYGRGSRDDSSDVPDVLALMSLGALHEEVESLFDIKICSLISVFFLSPANCRIRVCFELLGYLTVRERRNLLDPHYSDVLIYSGLPFY